MRLQERYDAIMEHFQKEPAPNSELNYSNSFELLIAVMLSAQCTDKRVNLTTPALFAAYPSAESLAQAKFEDIFALIKSISYPNNKARHLIGMAQKLVNDFKGNVPSTIDELMSLPGVGRKTANVVASIVWNEPVIAVDTHVLRVSHRLGLSKGKTPREVELDLEKHIAAPLRPTAHHYLLLHGRYVCTALKPKCEACDLAKWCYSFSKNSKN